MMIPITRKEKYINQIVGGGDTAPETPYTREEFFFAEILGEVIAPSPVTRTEKYLSAIAGQYSGDLPTPATRIELFLARAAGMDVNAPTPVTREEMFWDMYTAVKEIIGTLPLTFKARKSTTLDNYRIYGNTETKTRSYSGSAPLSFPIEDGAVSNYRVYGNTVNGESVGDLVTEGEHAGECCIPVTISRKAKHTATLQLHDCLPSNIQFDAPEALYYAENGLAAGTYCFTIQNYDTAYGGGKTYHFTLTHDVPVGGQLTFGWSYNTQAINAKIISYESSTSTTKIEQVSVSEGSTGINLGTTDGNSTNVNHIHRVRYGSNNYGESAIRQFLNSSAVAGSVWTPQTKYDRPPSWNSNTAGFMKDIDSDFLAVLGASPKVVALNTVTDGGGSVTINNDKFFLLSRSEVYGGKENNIDEGEPYPYYSNYSDLSAAYTGNDSNRIKYKSGAAQWWWLRSPHFANGSYVRSINPTGSVSGNSNANIAIGVAPACNIALDEDNKFNGQVLHVRDQISVTKGNQTLVFDVIGIDHDEVHFDKTTANIYLDEPLTKQGDNADYIDYAEQKRYNADGTSEDVTLPGITVPAGTDTLSVGTTVQPLSVAVDVSEIVSCGDKVTDSQSVNYGKYKIPVTLTAGSAETTDIYLDEPLAKSGNNADYIDYATQKRHNSDGTESSVTLLEIAVVAGTNTLTVGTEVQPSSVEIKGRIQEVTP